MRVQVKAGEVNQVRGGTEGKGVGEGVSEGGGRWLRRVVD